MGLYIASTSHYFVDDNKQRYEVTFEKINGQTGFMTRCYTLLSENVRSSKIGKSLMSGQPSKTRAKAVLTKIIKELPND